MAFIGIEEHWTSPELTAALEGVPEQSRDESLALNRRGDTRERLEDLADGRIAAMDEQGVDMQVIALAPPGTGTLQADDALALSRTTNDIAADAVRRHPTRLRAMATLPMTAPEEAAGELERAASLGLVGAMVYGRTGDVPLDDPRHDDLFATAAKLGLPIFIHPQIPSAAVRAANYSGFDPTTELALSTFGWGWHIEAAAAALRVMARGTLDRHPELQLILGHWGELLLFWGDRVDSIARVAGLDRTITEYLRSNVHITSSGMLNPDLLRHALAVTTSDRLLFSTDYPFQRPTKSDIQGFMSEFGSDQERAQFSSGNARRLFKIDEFAGEAR